MFTVVLYVSHSAIGRLGIESFEDMLLVKVCSV